MSLREIVVKLQDERVIETRRRDADGQIVYSLSHDLLVAKVVDWFDEREMQRRRAEETLERGLAEFGSSGALMGPAAVERVDQWLARAPSPVEADLVSRSHLAIEQRRQEDEARAQALEAERRRSIRRLRAGVVAALSLSVMAITVAAVAYRFFRSAHDSAGALAGQLRTATSDRLAAQSLARLAEGRLDMAALQAAAAFDTADTPQARVSLFSLIATYPYISRLLHGAADDVIAVAVSGDGAVVAAVDRSEGIVVWDRLGGSSGRRLVLQPGHPVLHWDPQTGFMEFPPYRVRQDEQFEGEAITLSRDGRILLAMGHLSAGSWGAVVWDADRGEPIGPVYHLHSGIPQYPLLSERGSLLAFSRSDGGVLIRDISGVAPEKVLTPPQHAGDLPQPALTADERIVVSAGGDGWMTAWDVRTGRVLKSSRGASGRAIGCDVSPTGEYALVSRDDGATLFYITDDRPPLTSIRRNASQLPLRHDARRLRAVFSDDGRRLAVTDGGVVYTLDTATGTQLSSLHPRQMDAGAPIGMTFTPRSRSLVIATDSRVIEDPIDGADYVQVENNRVKIPGCDVPAADGKRHRVAALGVRGDGSLVVASKIAKLVALWEPTLPLSPGRQIADSLQPGFGRFLDNSLLLMGADAEKWRMWDPSTGSLRESPGPPKELTEGSNCLATDGTGTRAAVGGGRDSSAMYMGSPGFVRVWQSGSIKPVSGQFDSVSIVAMSADGGTVAAGTTQGTILFVAGDPPTTRPTSGTMPKRPNAFTAIRLSRNGSVAVCTHRDGAVEVWDAREGRRIGSLTGSSKGPAVLSDDGTFVAIEQAGVIELYQVASDHLVPAGQLRCPGKSANVRLAFSPDNHFLASAHEGMHGATFSEDGRQYNILIWDLRQMQPLGPPVYHPVAREAHYAGVPELAFSADGNLLASSRGIATVIWDLDPRHWQARAKQIANREFTDSERDQYLRPAPR